MNLFELNICNEDYSELLFIIEDAVNRKLKKTISYINFNLLLNSITDINFHNTLDDFDILHPDGIGVYYASKFLYGNRGFKKKLTGTDLYLEIVNYFVQKRINVAFWGGSELASQKILDEIHNRNGKMNLCCSISNKVSELEAISILIKYNIDILFVGLGSPLQENIISKFKNLFNAQVIICVGSGIDYLSGSIKRAPYLIRKIGFEWLFRLLQSPKRLCKRYLLGIPHFIISVLIQKTKLLIRQKTIFNYSE